MVSLLNFPISPVRDNRPALSQIMVVYTKLLYLWRIDSLIFQLLRHRNKYMQQLRTKLFQASSLCRMNRNRVSVFKLSVGWSQRFFKHLQETIKINKKVNDEWIFFPLLEVIFNKNEIMLFIYYETNLEREKIKIIRKLCFSLQIFAKVCFFFHF